MILRILHAWRQRSRPADAYVIPAVMAQTCEHPACGALATARIVVISEDDQTDTRRCKHHTWSLVGRYQRRGFTVRYVRPTAPK